MLSFLTPRFPSDALEAEFRAELAADSQRSTRATLILVIGVCAAWAFVDLQLFPRYMVAMGTLRAITMTIMATAVVAMRILSPEEIAPHTAIILAAGSIPVTTRVHERLGDRYLSRPRGEIEVKGKGRMSAWLLDGAR